MQYEGALNTNTNKVQVPQKAQCTWENVLIDSPPSKHTFKIKELHPLICLKIIQLYMSASAVCGNKEIKEDSLLGKKFKWHTNRLSLNTGRTTFHNSMVLLSKGKKPSSLEFVISEALLRHKTPHQLLQETGNYYAHHFSSLLAHCSNHSPPTPLPPSPVSSSSYTSTEKTSWQNKCCNHSLLARISLPSSSLFPIIISARDKCLSHLLSGCTTAA